MKFGKRTLCLALTALLVCAALPLGGVFAASAEAAQYDPVWRAAPQRLTGDAGASVKVNEITVPMDANPEVTKEQDGDDWYYKAKLTIPAGSGGGNQFRAVFRTGYTAADLSWLSETAVLDALKPYLYLSFDFKLSGLHDRKSTRLYLKIQDSATDEQIYDSGSRSNTDAWTTVDPQQIQNNSTVSWAKGWMTVSVWGGGALIDAASEQTLEIDLRNLQISLDRSSKAAIDAALLATGTGWTYDKLVEQLAGDPYADAAGSDAIWYANPDRAAAKNGGDVSGSVQSLKTEYAATRVVDEDGVYYHTEMEIPGSGGNQYGATMASEIRNASPGFAWMDKTAVLNALKPYMQISFSYRYTGVKPVGNPQLILRFCSAYHHVEAEVTSMQSITPGEWVSVAEPLNKQDPWPEGQTWYSGLLNFSLYVWQQSFSGAQTLDLKDVQVELRACDRAKINKALAAVDGIDDIANFTAGKEIGTDLAGNRDYYALLTGAVTALDRQYDVNDDDAVDITDLVRMERLRDGSLTMGARFVARAAADGKTVTVTDVQNARAALLSAGA